MNIRRLHHRLLMTVALAAASWFGLGGLAQASYHANRLIDNFVFINADNMSRTEIQQFLEDKNSYLRNHKYKEVCTNDYMTARYANCGKTVLASQIIRDAAKAWGLNPRVIMATMQKEESLITDPNPDSSQVNFAMGYGCPDSGGCGSVRGFFNQVDNGTWQLRYNYEAVNGRDFTGVPASSYVCDHATNFYSNGLLPGNRVKFYSAAGYPDVTITIFNAATASMYCYTPHVGPFSQTGYSGSYNFVVSYEQWWGSTLGNPVRVTFSGDDITTGESGNSAKLKFSLVDKPSANVTIPVEVSDASEAKITKSSVIISPDDWNKPTSNALIVHGLNDTKRDGDIRYRLLAGRPSSKDKTYGSLSGADVSNPGLVNVDNEPDTALVGKWTGTATSSISLRRGDEFLFNIHSGHSADARYGMGRVTDSAFAGDFGGSGTATDLGLKRGSTYYYDLNHDGSADTKVSMGRDSDGVFVGDWDGDGRDELALRRGNQYFFDNNNNGHPDIQFAIGHVTDKLLVGNWDGAGGDSIGLKRGNHYYLLTADGHLYRSFAIGRDTDKALVGNWDGAGGDSIGLKRGSSYYLLNEAGNMTTNFGMGRDSDQALVGDWNGNGTDTVGLRRGNLFFFDNTDDGKSDSQLSINYYGYF